MQAAWQKDLDIASTPAVNNPMISCHRLEPGLSFTKFTMAAGSSDVPRWRTCVRTFRVVTQKCRPDRDITAPEMRAAWCRLGRRLSLSLRPDLRSDSLASRTESEHRAAGSASPIHRYSRVPCPGWFYLGRGFASRQGSRLSCGQITPRTPGRTHSGP